MNDRDDFRAGRHLGYIEGMLIAGSRDIATGPMEPRDK